MKRIKAMLVKGIVSHDYLTCNFSFIQFVLLSASIFQRYSNLIETPRKTSGHA